MCPSSLASGQPAHEHRWVLADSPLRRPSRTTARASVAERAHVAQRRIERKFGNSPTTNWRPSPRRGSLQESQGLSAIDSVSRCTHTWPSIGSPSLRLCCLSLGVFRCCHLYADPRLASGSFRSTRDSLGSSREYSFQVRRRVSPGMCEGQSQGQGRGNRPSDASLQEVGHLHLEGLGQSLTQVHGGISLSDLDPGDGHLMHADLLCQGHLR